MDIWQIDDSCATALVVSEFANRRIQMWTTSRLPYEPKGALLTARNHLRKQIRSLSAKPEEILDARYSASQSAFVDTENVLLYNVGTSAFNASSRFGLRFSREFSAPPKVEHSNINWHHHHSYEIVHGTKLQRATPRMRLRFSLLKLTQSLKPHYYWWAAKQGVFQTPGDNPAPLSSFCMSATLTGPAIRCGLAAIVKPLFDGVISTLHFDPRIQPSNIVCARIANDLRTSPDLVAQHLCDSAHAILGCRAIVRPTQHFVAWNPADENCHIGEIVAVENASHNWSVEINLSQNPNYASP